MALAAVRGDMSATDGFVARAPGLEVAAGDLRPSCRRGVGSFQGMASLGAWRPARPRRVRARPYSAFRDAILPRLWVFASP